MGIAHKGLSKRLASRLTDGNNVCW